MTGELTTIKDIATIAAPLTALVVETWIKPKLLALSKYLKANQGVGTYPSSVAANFQDYLLRAYEKHSFINVIVFQNQQKKLLDLYQPLTIKKEEDLKGTTIVGYPEWFLNQFGKILIRDTAGMGKSTLMKYLFLSCIQNNKAVPIFLELRKLKAGESIVNYICGELNAIDRIVDSDVVLSLLKQGGFVFFLDGYDEIPFREREGVTHNIQQFISKTGANLFILTSRSDSSLASFTDFQEFNIQPLEQHEAFHLLSRYDEGGELSTEIISRLYRQSLGGLQEFLTNPLLISLLYKSYEYKRTIPFKKHIFYRQVYDSLYESHDLSKGGSFAREKYSQLDLEAFHRILRHLGFATVKLGQIEFDKDSLLALISKAKAYFPEMDFQVTMLLKDLVTTVPLFVAEGNYYKWAHKSIQEYFAAQFIFLDSQNQKTKVLHAMSRGTNITKYLNILDLYYDIDYKAFRSVIILDLISDFIHYYDNSYEHVKTYLMGDNEIHRRKVATYGYAFVILPRKCFRRGITLSDGEIRSLAHSLILQAGVLNQESLANQRGFVKQFASPGNKNFLYVAEDLKRPIVQLLRRKKESFISYEGDLPHSVKLQDKLLDFDMPFVVDENPNLEANHRMFFNNVTDLLFAAFPHEIFKLAVCRKLRKEIQAEIDKETNADFLTLGI